MSGRELKPGKTTPGSAADIAKHDAQRPGKGTLAQRHTSPREELPNRIQGAENSYQLAIVQMQLETALSKEDDVHWLVGLVLDVAAGQLAAVCKAAEGATTAAQSVSYTAKAAIDATKKIAGAELAGGRRGAKGGYLKILRDEVFRAYSRIREDLAAGSDEEVAAAHAAFDPDHHLPSMYEAALRDKLDRFMKSDLRDIGITDKRTRGDGARGERFSTWRETRVVKVRWMSGAPTSYAYEHEDNADVATAGGTPELGKTVPPEFEGTAIDLHRRTWKDEPKEVVLNDLPAAHLPRITLGST